MDHIHHALTLLVSWFLFSLVFAQQEGPLPDGPDVNLVYAKCQQCHPINYVTDSAGLPNFLWQDTLALMKQLGMQVTDEEMEKLYQYFITYLGTNPPPVPTAAAGVTTEVDGAAVYAGTCAICHGAEGQGTSDAFPPLAGHAAKLADSDRSYLALVVVYGLSGEIEVAGSKYNGVMPGWGQLSNEEIAATLNMAMGSTPDVNVKPYTAGEIAQIRGLGLTGPEVWKRRPKIHRQFSENK